MDLYITEVTVTVNSKFKCFKNFVNEKINLGHKLLVFVFLMKIGVKQ